MSRKICDACNGMGEIWTDTPDHNGWGWKEEKSVCERCHGEGDLPPDEIDFDGELVRIRATGLVGICNIFGDNTIIVVAENDDEFFVGDLGEVELCAS